MKKWMIPVFAVGGVATVGAAVLGGILLFGGNKGGMETPEEVLEKVVQAQLIEVDYKELLSLGRYPMIKAQCNLEATDRQVLQCVDKVSEDWDAYVQSTLESVGGIDGYSVESFEQIPLDEDEIKETMERYGRIGEQVDDVVDVECKVNLKYGEGDEEHSQYMTIRTIEVDDGWYLDILDTTMATSLMNVYYELLETGQLVG